MEAFDTITEEVKENFGFSYIFRLLSIVNPAEIDLYRNSFPDNYVKEIASNYTILNKDKLKCELSVLYANDNVSGISDINELLKFINENRLDEIFSEVSNQSINQSLFIHCRQSGNISIQHYISKI